MQGLYLLALAGLFVFVAFRFEVGCDWSGYINQFQVFGDIPVADIPRQSDPLWVALFALQRQLELPYPWINVAAAALFFVGVHVLARRQQDPFAFLLLLFPVLIVNMPMSGIRQAAAIGVMCIAFAAFIDRKLIRFVVLTLVAAGLHTSAIVFLVFAPLVQGNYSKTRLLFALLLAIPGAMALQSTEAANIAVARYIDSGADAAGAVFRAAFLGVTSVFALVTLRHAWEETFPEDYKFMTVGALTMALPLALIPFSSVIADRIGYYLVPVQIMIFARLPYLPLRTNRQLYIAAPYIGLLLMFAVWTSRSSLFAQCYLPYRTWLFGFPEATYPFL